MIGKVHQTFPHPAKVPAKIKNANNIIIKQTSIHYLFYFINFFVSIRIYHMIHFTKWLQSLYESGLSTYRGGENQDWVSSDDYDQPSRYFAGGQYLKHPHRHAGYLARSKGQDRTKNPHPERTRPHSDWHNGWDDHHFIHEPKNRGYGASE
jgi:hypothetical protein